MYMIILGAINILQGTIYWSTSGDKGLAIAQIVVGFIFLFIGSYIYSEQQTEYNRKLDHIIDKLWADKTPPEEG